MSKALLVSRRTKERLYIKRCQKGDTGQYKEYDRVYCKAIRAAKTAYYAVQFEANASNLRKIWRLVRECQGKSQIRDSIPSTFNCNVKQVIVALNIANGVNEFLLGLVLNLPGHLMMWILRHLSNTSPPSLCRNLHFLQSDRGHGAQIPWKNAK